MRSTAALLAAAVSVSDADASNQSALAGVRAEPWSDGLALPANLAILFTMTALVVCFSAFAAVRICSTGSARLAHLLVILLLTAVLLVGICTWILTYTAARGILEEHTNRVLGNAATYTDALLRGDLSTGPVGLRLLAKQMESGQVAMDGLERGEPIRNLSLHENFLLLDNTLASAGGRSIVAIYLGTTGGAIQGISRESAADYDLWIGVGPRRCGPAETLGTCLTPAPGLRCSGENRETDCQHENACAAPGGGCEWCHTRVSVVVDDGLCPGCRRCPSWQPGSFDSFPVGADPSGWDLPPTAGRLGGICLTEVQGERPPGMVTRHGRGGTAWHGVPGGQSDCSKWYDPRVRPWYALSDTVVWSDPYQFLTPRAQLEGGVPEVNLGITAALGVRSTHSSGPDRPWVAVVAVDFTLAAISGSIAQNLPSPGSVVMVAEKDGTLLGISDPQVQPEASLTADGTPVYRPLVVNATDFRYYSLVQDVLGHYDSLAEIAEARRILQLRDSTAVCGPITIDRNMVWILIISMPYSDFREEGEQATTAALGLVLVSSAVGAAVTYALLHVLLEPLGQLADDMRHVAEMELDQPKPTGNAYATEVRSMGARFSEMVQNLVRFRRFLPEAVLLKYEPQTVVPAPEGDIAIVFTDIIGSTKLWEASPGGMDEALTLHNDCLRGLVRRHKGYEVKTIGDSFMVAFADPVDAARFGLSAQQDLLDCPWPEDPELAQANEKWAAWKDPQQVVVWRGVAIRVGVSYGAIQREENPTTERYDYRGAPVNLAARLESTAYHGCVHLSVECYNAIAGAEKLMAETAFLRREGVLLKGIGELPTWTAVPLRLRSRLEQLGPPPPPNPLAARCTGSAKTVSRVGPARVPSVPSGLGDLPLEDAPACTHGELRSMSPASPEFPRVAPGASQPGFRRVSLGSQSPAQASLPDGLPTILSRRGSSTSELTVTPEVSGFDRLHSTSSPPGAAAATLDVPGVMVHRTRSVEGVGMPPLRLIPSWQRAAPSPSCIVPSLSYSTPPRNTSLQGSSAGSDSSASPRRTTLQSLHARSSTRGRKQLGITYASVVVVHGIDEGQAYRSSVSTARTGSALQQVVALCSQQANRTRGSLNAVLGPWALLTWNVDLPCPTHTSQAVSFASALRKRAPSVTIGVASGPLLHGPVSALKRNFHTVFGLVPHIAFELSSEAAAYGTNCLAGYLWHDSCYTPPEIAAVSRPVDQWSFFTGAQTEPQCVARIEAPAPDLHTDNSWLRAAEFGGIGSPRNEVEVPLSPGEARTHRHRVYREKWEQAWQGSAEALEWLTAEADRNPGDAVLARAVRRIPRGGGEFPTSDYLHGSRRHVPIATGSCGPMNSPMFESAARLHIAASVNMDPRDMPIVRVVRSELTGVTADAVPSGFSDVDTVPLDGHHVSTPVDSRIVE
eukprot:TRINITY_DN1137_c0_g1_i3.p1 TRINITY_DN1137_c0_g1~~TRINITY_DN1137_c0_g1_i3.p1  ORF type:complete len:1418 (+),score=267.54 TRINITY_DN1137_c0_g1_i3:81-4334(+)